VFSGEPYYFPGCTSSNCVFPNAMIPASAISAPAQALLSYIPQPNVLGGQCPSVTGCFSSSAFAQTVRDDKLGFRVDANTGWGTLTGYYFFDDFSLASPYLGASLPGFATTTFGRSQQGNVSDTKTFSSTAVNEFRINYTREATNPLPTGGIGPKTSSFGIPTGPSTPGVVVLAPSLEGVPSVATNEFSLGVNPFTEYQINNTAQILDNFTKVRGTHTFKFGGSFHLSQIDIFDRGANNGTWSFDGSETGSDFADFLLGAPINYLQGSQVPMYTTSRYYLKSGVEKSVACPNAAVPRRSKEEVRDTAVTFWRICHPNPWPKILVSSRSQCPRDSGIAWEHPALWRAREND